MQTRSLSLPLPAPNARGGVPHPLDVARTSEDLRTAVFACVIREALLTRRHPLIGGLAEAEFQRLLVEHFPGLTLTNGETRPGLTDSGDDEFADLVYLLLEYRALPDAAGEWLCYAVASAAMGENHLWQDMGLPSRKLLSELMRTHFPALAAKNVGDMKWKKFFYRQLCERAEVPICKSPNCAACCDHHLCFGPEEA